MTQEERDFFYKEAFKFLAEMNKILDDVWQRCEEARDKDMHSMQPKEKP